MGHDEGGGADAEAGQNGRVITARALPVRLPGVQSGFDFGGQAQPKGGGEDGGGGAGRVGYRIGPGVPCRDVADRSGRSGVRERPLRFNDCPPAARTAGCPW